MQAINSRWMGLFILLTLLYAPLPGYGETLGATTPLKSDRPGVPRLKSAKATATVQLKGEGSVGAERAEVYYFSQPEGGAEPSTPGETVIQVGIDDNRYLLVGLPELSSPGAFPGKRRNKEQMPVSTVHYYDEGKIFASTEGCKVQVTAVEPVLVLKVSSCLLTHTRAAADGTVEVDAEEVQLSLHVRAAGPLVEKALAGEPAVPGQAATRRNDALCAYSVWAGIRVAQIYGEIQGLSQQLWWNPWAWVAIYNKYIEADYWLREAVTYHPYCY